MNERTGGLSDQALELVMRDVLDGLEDLALRAALVSGDSGCRVLFIAPALAGRQPMQTTTPPIGAAEVIDFRRYRKVPAA